ncbi:MAG: hypothetical protein FWD34_04240 [Oscillospiraceae bacterium]|nr:hypothetical protein [Oscillospiraceae bacterium]
MNKNSPFKAFAVAGQISAVTITPLLLFLGGGSWLVDRMNWEDRLKGLFAAIGIIVMLVSVTAYLINLIKMYDNSEKKKLHFDKKDYDFYDYE